LSTEQREKGRYIYEKKGTILEDAEYNTRSQMSLPKLCLLLGMVADGADGADGGYKCDSGFTPR